MKGLLNKIKFYIKKPPVIVLIGQGSQTAKEAILAVLTPHFKIDKELLIYQANFDNLTDLKFLLKNSKQPILLASHTSEYYSDKEFFPGDNKIAENILKIADFLPSRGYFIFNYDDEAVRDISQKIKTGQLSFGFGIRADLRASDIVLTQSPNLGTNFKINYQGKIVPIWLKNLFGKENIYAALAAAMVGEILGINLVEISNGLKEYKGVDILDKKGTKIAKTTD